MKQTFKRVIGIVLAVILCVSCLSGCFGGKDDVVTLTFCTTGGEGPNTDKIIKRVNEILLEKVGVQIEFNFLTTENYNLVVSLGDEYDLISTPDWLNYWQNSAQGAFAEITDEELQEHAPYIWEKSGKGLDYTKYKGTRYAVAGIFTSSADRCYAGRGDLMDKYGIEDLNSFENVEKYLTAIAENEKDIIPFDMPGTVPWQMLALYVSDLGWCPIGGLSYGEHVYFRLDDPERKVFIAAEQPEMLEFTKAMKRWNDKGFFSKSVLSNKTSSVDSFKAGRSALAFVDNPAACQTLYDELSKDDRAAWDVRFYSRYQKSQLVNNLTAYMLSISANTKHKEECIKVINELYANEELYRIVYYGGLKGEEWDIAEDGSFVQYAKDDDLAWLGVSIKNDEWDIPKKFDFPGHEELCKKVIDIRDINPAVNMPVSDEGIREIKIALSEVFNQYTGPRYYGAIKETPEKAIELEMEKLKAAGIYEYRDNLQKQLDEYLEMTGE